MKRTLIQLDEDTYHKVRHRAFERKQSISAVVRELVSKGLAEGRQKKSGRLKDFKSVASGASKQAIRLPISEMHDEILADSFEGFREK